jgi:hypothetical protein
VCRIESLNSVLDDNHLLTMPSGERIQVRRCCDATLLCSAVLCCALLYSYLSSIYLRASRRSCRLLGTAVLNAHTRLLLLLFLLPLSFLLLRRSSVRTSTSSSRPTRSSSPRRCGKRLHLQCHLILKTSIYQDRLGTNTGTSTQNKEAFCFLQATVSRNAIIFLSDEDFDVNVLIKSWIETQPDATKGPLSDWMCDHLISGTFELFNHCCGGARAALRCRHCAALAAQLLRYCMSCFAGCYGSH